MRIEKVRKKTAKPFVFLHGAKVCAYEKVPDVGQKIMDGLDRLMQKRKIAPAGAPIWSYQKAGIGKLKLTAGIPVKKGTRAEAPFAAAVEPEWPCISAEYTGSMENIIEAWMELFEYAEEKNLDITDERREIYRKWTVFDSKENVTELQLRLAPKVKAKIKPKTKVKSKVKAKPKAKPKTTAKARPKTKKAAKKKPAR